MWLCFFPLFIAIEARNSLLEVFRDEKKVNSILLQLYGHHFDLPIPTEEDLDEAIKLQKSIRTSNDQSDFRLIAVGIVKKNLKSLVDIYHKNVTGLPLKSFAPKYEAMK